MMVSSLWAKTGPDGTWHPLVAHLLDVAAATRAILEREPRTTREQYENDFGLSGEQAIAWASALAALHDIGKASPAFQAKWPEGAERVRKAGLTWSRINESSVPHGVITNALIPRLLQDAGWDPRPAKVVADALGAHHGFKATPTEQRDAKRHLRLLPSAWKDAHNAIFNIIVATLQASTSPEVSVISADAFMRLAGLVSFADWIGSTVEHFPLGRDPSDSHTYYLEALSRARDALDRIGWRQKRPAREELPSFADVFSAKSPQPFEPRELQRVVERLTKGVGGPSFLLIEAPTGEGKTEAAYYAHLALQSKNAHRGLYIALPTQATGNAMYERTLKFLKRLDLETPLDLQLVHGAALLNSTYADIQLLDIDRENPASGTVTAEEWFTSRKRALLSEYGVGTVDQALLSILNVKHQFVRLWGLANRTVVLDEVHAYDLYTSTLIDTLICWLRALGSSVIVMTATLPPGRRDELLNAFGTAKAKLPPYPRVVMVDGNETTAASFPTRPQQAIRISATPLDVNPLATKILERTQHGGCTCCIVNTVQRAQDLFRALREGAAAYGVQLDLFHARFPAEQRRDIEKRVVVLYGADRQCRPERGILVATQVVEQSLDLDFDWMVTDLAPIDLMLQRAGRLHRHAGKARPKHMSTPELGITDLAGDPPELTPAKYIYDEFVLLRTWWAVRSRSTIRSPEDVEELIDLVYRDEIPEGLSNGLTRRFEAALEKLNEERTELRVEAQTALIGQPDQYLDLLPPRQLTDEENPEIHQSLLGRTRLGGPSVTVVPLHYRSGLYFLDEQATIPVRLDQPPSFDDAVQLVMRSVSLARKGVVQALLAKEKPKAWKDSALLRYTYPLILKDRHVDIGGTVVTLDPELGITYEQAE